MTSSHRRAYVDWARGIAVLLMIEAHTRRRLDAPEPRRPPDDSVSRCDRPRRVRGAAVPLAGRPRGRPRRNADRGADRQPARGGRDDLPPRPRDLHPRVSLPPAGFHRHARQPPGDAVPRRHPQHHGTGDGRRGTGLGRSLEARRCASTCYAAIAAAFAMADADRADARQGSRRGRSGCSGTCARRASSPSSRCFRGPASCSPAARWARCSRRRATSARSGGCTPRSASPARRSSRSASTRPAARRSIASSSFWTSSPTWFAIRLGILMMALTAIYGCETAFAALKGRATRRCGAGLPGSPKRAERVAVALR